MLAISKAESNCRIKAKGDTHLTYKRNNRIYGYSISVLQVRILEGREHCDEFNIKINIQCAYQIWESQGYEAWTMYTNNEYLKYLGGKNG